MKNKVLFCTILLLILSFTACNSQDETKANNSDTKTSKENTASNDTLPHSNQTKEEVKKSDLNEFIFTTPDLRYVEDFEVDGHPSGGEPEIRNPLLNLHPIQKIPHNKTKLKSALEIEYINNKLYVVDEISNCIAILDLEGNRVDTWGQLGSKPGEFSSPKDIAYNLKNKHIYVLDNANHRIQEFDSEHNYIKEISLKNLKVESPKCYQSISIDSNDNIYITFSGGSLPELRMCRINSNEEVFRYPWLLYGECFEHNGNIYCFDTFEIQIYREKAADYATVQGKSSLYKINKDDREKLYAFPNAYSPGFVCFHNENIYAFSSSLFTLDLFEKTKPKLKYKYTLSNEVNYYNIDIFDINATIVDNFIYFSKRHTGELYKLSLSEVNDNEKQQ